MFDTAQPQSSTDDPEDTKEGRALALKGLLRELEGLLMRGYVDKARKRIAGTIQHLNRCYPEA